MEQDDENQVDVGNVDDETSSVSSSISLDGIGTSNIIHTTERLVTNIIKPKEPYEIIYDDTEYNSIISNTIKDNLYFIDKNNIYSFIKSILNFKNKILSKLENNYDFKLSKIVIDSIKNEYSNNKLFLLILNDKIIDNKGLKPTDTDANINPSPYNNDTHENNIMLLSSNYYITQSLNVIHNQDSIKHIIKNDKKTQIKIKIGKNGVLPKRISLTPNNIPNYVQMNISSDCFKYINVNVSGFLIYPITLNPIKKGVTINNSNTISNNSSVSENIGDYKKNNIIYDICKDKSDDKSCITNTLSKYLPNNENIMNILENDIKELNLLNMDKCTDYIYSIGLSLKYIPLSDYNNFRIIINENINNYIRATVIDMVKKDHAKNAFIDNYKQTFTLNGIDKIKSSFEKPVKKDIVNKKIVKNTYLKFSKDDNTNKLKYIKNNCEIKNNIIIQKDGSENICIHELYLLNNNINKLKNIADEDGFCMYCNELIIDTKEIEAVYGDNYDSLDQRGLNAPFKEDNDEDNVNIVDKSERVDRGSKYINVSALINKVDNNIAKNPNKNNIFYPSSVKNINIMEDFIINMCKNINITNTIINNINSKNNKSKKFSIDDTSLQKIYTFISYILFDIKKTQIEKTQIEAIYKICFGNAIKIDEKTYISELYDIVYDIQNREDNPQYSIIYDTIDKYKKLFKTPISDKHFEYIKNNVKKYGDNPAIYKTLMHQLQIYENMDKFNNDIEKSEYKSLYEELNEEYILDFENKLCPPYKYGAIIDYVCNTHITTDATKKQYKLHFNISNNNILNSLKENVLSEKENGSGSGSGSRSSLINNIKRRKITRNYTTKNPPICNLAYLEIECVDKKVGVNTYEYIKYKTNENGNENEIKLTNYDVYSNEKPLTLKLNEIYNINLINKYKENTINILNAEQEAYINNELNVNFKRHRKILLSNCVYYIKYIKQLYSLKVKNSEKYLNLLKNKFFDKYSNIATYNNVIEKYIDSIKREIKPYVNETNEQYLHNVKYTNEPEKDVDIYVSNLITDNNMYVINLINMIYNSPYIINDLELIIFYHQNISKIKKINK